jgi:hypothetical protein
LVFAERFVDSPCGPYLSLSIAQPARLGVHPGFYFSTSVLNNGNARRLGRQYWGYPHELGVLHWISEGSQRGIFWEERGLEVRAEVIGRPLPVLVPGRSMQRRTDGPVINPIRLKALARRARVGLITPEEDSFAPINGFHRGFTLSGMVVRRNPARRPAGLFAMFRVPLRAPEPGVLGAFPPQLREQRFADPPAGLDSGWAGKNSARGVL